MTSRSSFAPGLRFRQFFVRGLGILLPTVLTIWILLAAYQFVQFRIATPINRGVRELILTATPWPRVTREDMAEMRAEVRADSRLRRAYRETDSSQTWLHAVARRRKLNRWWAGYSFGLDLFGLALAIVLIYAVGVVLGSYIGRRLYQRGERVINRVPLIRRVYPSVKQVTDFFVGDSAERLKFNRVVAVEYPRKGVWSVGLVTGQTMRTIAERSGVDCLTVFVPSSPTPFTGYVVTAPRSEMIELPLTVEDALKFAVSGGVLIPPNQRIGAGTEESAAEVESETETNAAAASSPSSPSSTEARP